MSRIEALASRYQQHIRLPWGKTLAGAERVLMVVYDKDLERVFRARKVVFQQATTAAGHGWEEVDCTRMFSLWIAAEKYREAYFESPDDLSMKLEGAFLPHVASQVRTVLARADENKVVALTGVASLYGFLRVSELIRSVEPDIRGRLAVFFPGSKDGNNYRLLDARDGWNYLAAGISLHSAARVT